MTTPEATAVEGVTPLPAGNIYFVLSYHTETGEFGIRPIQDALYLPREGVVEEKIVDFVGEGEYPAWEVINDPTWCAYVNTVGEVIKAGKEAKPLTPLLPPTKDQKTLDEVLKTIIK